MTDVRQLFNELLDSDKFSDLVDEVVVWRLKQAYEICDPSLVHHDADRRDSKVMREALRMAHNYFTEPDDHID